jgi:probable F420-dependent oxidoreductase
LKIGIILPQDLQDRVSLRDFVQAVEALGFDHIVFPDHVVGANPTTHRLNSPYTHESYFHELFVTMGFVAGITQRIELVSGVLILPQRQTALVAKQAAHLDVLSEGRLRIGVGVGRNHVEYDVLGEDFLDRGKRLDEQIEVLRRLWCEDLVTFEGKWHTIVDAGINPLPIQKPIPIWMGGWSAPMIRRIARTGNGWLLYCPLETVGRKSLESLRRECAAAGRDPVEIGVQAWILLNKSDVMAGARQKRDAHELRPRKHWALEARAWKEAGATHVDCWTMYGNLTSADQHVELARQFKETMAEVL